MIGKVRDSAAGWIKAEDERRGEGRRKKRRRKEARGRRGEGEEREEGGEEGEEKGERVNVVEKDEEKSKRIQLRAVFSRKGKHVEDVEYEEDTPVLVPKGFDLTRARGKDEALQIPYHYSVS